MQPQHAPSPSVSLPRARRACRTRSDGDPE
ncbi:hypothetical protein PVAP13_3NG178014 [Panicum virgatum]|uniref:Uncharacterized protein n=1 Tax=Panicum virgatum TaxID=38727 RepID=A0A8T0U5J9_PANVG|nr:hypothetical protein PVAP13_3NG178014 [Panicum virgatum]